MIDVLDSYLNQIKTQMGTVDSAQTFGGMIEARDWPMTPVQFGSLYLLMVAAIPIGGTPAQRLYEYQMQWSWLLIGDDIGNTQQAENRSGRYRQNMTILQNLRQAHFPQYCQKQLASADSQGNVTFTPVKSTYPLSNVESIWWGNLRFVPKSDNNKSGLTYGVAAISVFGFDDVLATLAA